MPTKNKKAPKRAKVSSSNERTVQHMRISDDMHKSIKTMAARNSQTLNEFYDDACNWFLKEHARRRYESYLAPLNRGKYRTLWVDSRLLERLGKASQRDDVAVARVIFTALRLYLIRK